MWFGRENDENMVRTRIDVVGLRPLPSLVALNFNWISCLKQQQARS